MLLCEGLGGFEAVVALAGAGNVANKAAAALGNAAEETLAKALQLAAEQMTTLLENGSSTLPNEYHKVWRSYLSQKNKGQADDHTKELMRQKVKRLQDRYGVSNYRIYTDLRLNPGNLNAWLKHGHSDKVSLETARRTLRYVEQAAVL